MAAMDIHQRDDLAFPQSLPEFQQLFPDDAACAAYLGRARWPDGFVCPHCGQIAEPFRIVTRPGVLECRACRRQAGLLVGTVMERSHTPLSVWFWAAYRASLPAEDATQGLVDVEALDQGAGGGNAQDRLGHESSGEGAAVLGRPARPPGRLRNERFEADHVERGDETAQRFGDRIVVLAHPREQKALDVAPASLHRVERVVCHVYSHG